MNFKNDAFKVQIARRLLESIKSKDLVEISQVTSKKVTSKNLENANLDEPKANLDEPKANGRKTFVRVQIS